MKLQIVFYQWYVIFTDGFTNGQIKTPIALHDFLIGDMLNLPMEIQTK